MNPIDMILCGLARSEIEQLALNVRFPASRWWQMGIAYRAAASLDALRAEAKEKEKARALKR